MKRIFNLLSFSLLAFFLTTSFSLALDPLDESVDYENMSPSQIHRVLGEMKAGSLEKARAFEAAAAKTVSVYDQTEYDVNYYNVDIEVVIPDSTIYGNVEMEAQSTIDGLDSIEVDFYSNLVVDSVYTSAGLLNYSHASNKLFIELDGIYNQGESFSFWVRYHGMPVVTGLDGFSFDTRINGEKVVATLSEPMSARTWWPCKDRPDDKADSMDITITCDTAYFCASNGKMIDTTRNGDGTWTFDYEVRYPITTYLFSLAIAKYAVWHDWYHYGPTDSMIIVNHVYSDLLLYSQAKYNVTPGAIGIFASIFGEYPFINEKYGHANFEWTGGMEHQTVTSMTGTSFGFKEQVVVHELGHQWWGDMITCDNWHDIWLNEGFASYCEALYYEFLDSEDHYHAYMDSMTYTNGGSIYIIDTTNVWNIFGTIVYDKGAWVLHMLRNVVGEQDFFDIFPAYYNSAYQYGSATTEDFKNVCESVSGMDLDFFFDEWIYGTYFPKYYWTYMCEPDPNDGKYWTYLSLQQTQNSTPQVFEMPVDLVFTSAAGPDTMVLYNDVRNKTYIFKTDDSTLNLELDPKNWILKQSDYTDWNYHLIPFPLDTAEQFEPYLDSLIVRGGKGSSFYKINSGSLPAGLNLDTLTGFISGVPTEFGDFTFDVYAKDRDTSLSEIVEYNMHVNEGTALPGDADYSGAVNILDATYLINYLYKDGPEPPIVNQGDPDASCAINILDVTYLINYLYKDGPAPLWGCVE